MDMGGVEQRYQHVHDQERHHVALRLIPQSINDLGDDQYRRFSSRQQRDAMSLLDAVFAGRKHTPHQLGNHPASRRAASGRELFCGLKYILIDVQSGAHDPDHHAHQASDVK
jgi:hypothetical protein